MPVSTRAFYSIVKNTSGVERHFSFLPNGGRTLAAGEEYSYFGDIRQEIGNKAGSESSSRRRDREAFMRAITTEALTVLETPAPISMDEENNDSARSYLISGDTVVVIDPYTWQPPEYPSSSASSTVSASSSA